MADLFISYARDDHDRVRQLARVLEGEGFSVWWDRDLVGGDEFSAEIETALDVAGAVIVCWSGTGAKSRWVKDEASIAADGNKLICISLDGKDAPIGFRQFHCIDFSKWTGDASSTFVHELIHAARVRLEGPQSSQPARIRPASTETPRTSRRWLVSLGVLVLAAVAAGAWWWTGERSPASAPRQVERSNPDSDAVRRYGIMLPEHAPVDFIGSSPLRTPVAALAITPDGNRLVYTGPSATERSQLFIRDLAEFEVRPLPGTGGAYQPFISPDGQRVAFFAHDELRVAHLDGGSVRTVLSAANPRGGAWWGNDRIIYSDREGSQTWWVGINGGQPQALVLAQQTMPDGRPIALNEIWTPMPDGERFLVTAFPGIESFGRLCVLDPATGGLTTVIDLAVFGRGANGGLVYVIGNDLLAMQFDNAAGTVLGDPVTVGSELRRDGTLPQFVLSDRALIYATGAPYRQRQVARVGVDGELSPTPIADDRFGDLAVSSDGRRVAATKIGNQFDIWLYDLSDGLSRKLTRGGDNHHPMWSQDGDTIFFKHDGDDDVAGIYRTSASSADFSKELVIETDNHLDRVSAGDLGTLAVNAETGRDYSVVDLETGQQIMVANQPDVVEDLGDVSPDRRWMALTVDASGRYEIVVIPFRRDGAAVQVSIDGGEEPLWSPDQSQLYFRYGTRLFRAPVSEDGDGLAFGTPEIIYEDPMWINVGGYSYWPDGSGQGFLILRENQPPTTRELRVVEGWRSIR